MDKARFMHWLLQPLIACVFLISAQLNAGGLDSVLGEKIKLQKVEYQSLSGNQLLVQLVFSDAIEEPKSFSIDDPARIIWDFEQVESGLEKNQFPIALSFVRNLVVVESQQRTRVVLNLVEMLPNQTTVQDNIVSIKIGDGVDIASVAPEQLSFADQPVSGIYDIDFRRGVQGEGRVVIKLADMGTPVDIQQKGQSLIARFLDVQLAPNMEKRLDVVDFATPVQFIDVMQSGRDVSVVVMAQGDYEHLAYQVDDKYLIEVRPLTEQEKIAKQASMPRYVGDKISLNFQDIEVRSVLQLIADFSGFNLVTTDSVVGNITIRLDAVPWDQALEIVLKTKGLAKRQEGNIILVAPAQELAAREQLELEANQQVEQLAPLRTELMQVNYARAEDMADFIRSEGSSLLSVRGKVAVDPRTNTLLIQETSVRLEEIRKLLVKLDRPVRQVLIEARVVVANHNFNHELGVRFGLTTDKNKGNVSGTLESTGAIAAGADGIDIPLDDRLSVNLPLADPAGSIGFSVSRLPGGTLLDLELSALEEEGKGEIISSPRLITSDQSQALIESGEEIPFRTTTSSNGVTEVTITFKKAVLALKVTPQITPDDRIILELEVTQDTRGEETEEGPAIDTQFLETQVLADNGETIVLGGVYRQTVADNLEKVPLFGDLPLIGRFFRRTTSLNKKQELLIFVTPKIIKERIDV